MLSTENPPPDPSDDLSQLKSCKSNNDNYHQVDADLFKSGLDDINHTLPKFSIRDYVFNTRGKDITNHWPFSSKNLQLCLKHGVKDVLPPFQTLEYVKTPSTVTSSEENISNNVVQKLVALDSENLKSNPSQEDKEYPSTSVSCSDVNSVPFRIQSPFSELEAEILPGPSLEKPEFAARADNQKKCRLIVKVGNNIPEPKSYEDTSLNKETMASNVCPVCKTFSSSSNTTLNAHIDQCLSGESPIKWTKNSKTIKHRIKPRKTRLMVDIYETALSCTLEDLDRRNGTNWASNLGFQAQDLENNYNNMHSSVNNEEKIEEGAVYFDSNGTKLRILSNFSDVQSKANVDKDCGPRKLVKGDKGSKIVSSKKNKYLVQHKLLKCPPYGERRCSPRLDHRRPEVNISLETKFLSKESEREDLAQTVKARDQMKSNGSGMIKQWVSSKRTGHKKKKIMKHESHYSNEVIKKSKSTRTTDSRFSISSDDDPVSATESHKRKENMTFNSDDEYVEQEICRTNRAGFALLDSQDFYSDKKNHLMPVKCNVKQLKKVGPSRNHESCLSNKKMRIISPTANLDSSFVSSRVSKEMKFGSLKKTSMRQAILSGGKKLLSLSKNSLSVRHESISGSKKKLGSMRLDFKKTRLHYENAAQMEKDSGNSSTDRARVLKIRKKKWGSVNTREEVCTPSKSSNAYSESNSHEIEQNIDSFVDDIIIPVGTSNDAVKVVEIQDDFVREPILAFGESLGDEQKMLCEDNVGEALVVDVNNTNNGDGNYCIDVDTIPIPGPPGSFLPSPGRMPSEELQGNSSLTTCRLHSSEDERELIDMGSSDSPISIQLGSQSDIIENQTERVTESSNPFERDESRAKLVIPETKFPNCGNCESSPSLSTSNPVLRLMGKNLMVVNKEQNVYPQTMPTSQTSTVNGFPNIPFRVDDAIISGGNIQNEHRSFHHTFSEAPSVFSNTQMYMPMQRFDFTPNFRTSDEWFRSSLECREYAGGYFYSPDQLRSNIRRPDSPITHEVETEASLAFKTTYRENMESGVRSRGYNDSRLVNPFYSTYQTRCYPFCNGSQIDQNRNAHLPPYNGVNGNPISWNIRTPDGFTDSSPSTGHSRTSLYFPPGFSSLHTNFT